MKIGGGGWESNPPGTLLSPTLVLKTRSATRSPHTSAAPSLLLPTGRRTHLPAGRFSCGFQYTKPENSNTLRDFDSASHTLFHFVTFWSSASSSSRGKPSETTRWSASVRISHGNAGTSGAHLFVGFFGHASKGKRNGAGGFPVVEDFIAGDGGLDAEHGDALLPQRGGLFVQLMDDVPRERWPASNRHSSTGWPAGAASAARFTPAKSGSGLPLSEARGGAWRTLPGWELKVITTLVSPASALACAITAALWELAKRLNLPFANLEVKAALAVGGHVALRLVIAVQGHIGAGNRLVIFVQHLAGHNMVGGLEDERRQFQAVCFGIALDLLLALAVAFGGGENKVLRVRRQALDFVAALRVGGSRLFVQRVVTVARFEPYSRSARRPAESRQYF